MAEAWQRAQRIVALKTSTNKFEKYREDPVGFCEEVIGSHFTEDIKKVVESVRDNPVTIVQSGNSVGKSHSAAHIAAWWYSCFPDSQVYATAAPPLDNLKKILWGELLTIVRNKPTLFSGDRKKNLLMQRHSKHFIAGVSIPMTGSPEDRIAKFSGKHSPHLLFIVDEGDAVPDEVYTGIETCMSGGHTRLLVLFNPKAKVGPVYYKQSRGLANTLQVSALNHPNVVTGEEIIPGAVDRQTTVRRINQWTRELAQGEPENETCFQVPEYLVGATAVALDGKTYPPLPPTPRVVEQPEFWYIVCAVYPTQDTRQLIDESWIKRAQGRWMDYRKAYGDVPPQTRPIQGIDLAEYGTDYNFSCLRYGGYVAPFIFWGGMDLDIASDKAIQIHVKYNVELTKVDANGIGASVAPAMVRKGRKQGLDIATVGVKVSEKPSPLIKTPLGEFYQLRDQLWWQVREWLKNDPNAMLPPDPMLEDELKTPTYKYTLIGSKIKVMDKNEMRDKLKRSPDRADSLCLTFAPMERAKVMTLYSEE
jgi:hypothetical protein